MFVLRHQHAYVHKDGYSLWLQSLSLFFQATCKCSNGVNHFCQPKPGETPVGCTDSGVCLFKEDQPL